MRSLTCRCSRAPQRRRRWAARRCRSTSPDWVVRRAHVGVVRDLVEVGPLVRLPAGPSSKAVSSAREKKRRCSGLAMSRASLSPKRGWRLRLLRDPGAMPVPGGQSNLWWGVHHRLPSAGHQPDYWRRWGFLDTFVGVERLVHRYTFAGVVPSDDRRACRLLHHRP